MTKKTTKHTTHRTHHTHHHAKAQVSYTAIFIGVMGVVVGILSILFVQQQTSAKDNNASNQPEIVRKDCNAEGDPVINVTQRIINDVDSGEAGNYWAYDTINREIKVWKVSEGKYCATVSYEGQFAAIAGQKSPGNTGILTGSEKGTFQGGYRADITGTLMSNPALPTHGSLGITNYQCDTNGNCPGSFDWTTKYFNTGASGFTFSMPWWGWTYRNGDHVWVNASTGNSGDIL